MILKPGALNSKWWREIINDSVLKFYVSYANGMIFRPVVEWQASQNVTKGMEALILGVYINILHIKERSKKTFKRETFVTCVMTIKT